MRGIRILLLPALLALAPLACAQTPAPPAATASLDNLLEKVELARRKVETLKARVEYVRTVEALDIEEEFTGSFVFKMPRFLRMELQEKGEDARKRTYVIGGKYAWIAYPDKKQAERFFIGETQDLMQMDRTANPFEYGLTHGIRELLKSFDARMADEEEIGGAMTDVLELTPKPAEGEAAPTGRRLVLWIDKESSLPVRVREYKSRGQIVETFTLSECEVNATVAGSSFDYEPPTAYEVIPYGEELKAEGPE